MTIPAAFTRWGLLLLGVILVIVGLAIAAQPVTFGWFTSAPVSEGAFVKLPWTLVSMQLSGAIALGSGIALIAGSVGFLLGRRARRSE